MSDPRARLQARNRKENEMTLITTIGIRECGQTYTYAAVCFECERFERIEAYGCCASCA